MTHALAVMLMAAAGFVFIAPRFPENRVTYSCGSPEMRDAVRMWASVSAIEDGGCASNPDIVLVIPEQWEGGPFVWGMASPSRPQATVWIRRDHEHDLGVYVHEVGHALGLGHSSDKDAAMNEWCCNPLNSDDVAGIQTLYGADYRLRLPMTASDTEMPRTSATSGASEPGANLAIERIAE